MSHVFLQRRLNDPRFQSRAIDMTARTAVTPWYASSPSSFAPVNNESTPQLTIRKRHNFAKRKKVYTSDSSGSERETEGHKEGVIHRAPSGSSHDYYVYYNGRKITFGDSSMPNKNHDDKARANFNARHSCSEKTDKNKAGSRFAPIRISLTHTQC